LLRHLAFISIKFEFDKDLGYGVVHLNNENVEEEIRLMEVSNNVSKVAAIHQVRKMLVAQQQEIGREGGVVMDGRDIGTVVFPNAELKLFMTASAEKRAERRYNELKQKGNDVSYEEVLKNVEERDHLDSTRETSPLVKAQDAIEIDNTNLNKEEQFDKILSLVKEKTDA